MPNKETLETMKKDVDYHRNLVCANLGGVAFISSVCLNRLYERQSLSTTGLIGLGMAMILTKGGEWQHHKQQALQQELDIFVVESENLANHPNPLEPAPVD